MNIEKIKNANTKVLGKNIVFYKEIGSTQDEIRKMAEKHTANGTLVIADNQFSGKGTKGRVWTTESGKNITMSLVIYPNCKVEELEGLTINIAEAIKEAIKEPNDLMINGKKICGILTQSVTLAEKVDYVLIGIGFNVNQAEFEGELLNIATSLKKEFNMEFEREEIVAKILEKLENRITNII